MSFRPLGFLIGLLLLLWYFIRRGAGKERTDEDSTQDPSTVYFGRESDRVRREVRLTWPGHKITGYAQELGEDPPPPPRGKQIKELITPVLNPAIIENDEFVTQFDPPALLTITSRLGDREVSLLAAGDEVFVVTYHPDGKGGYGWKKLPTRVDLDQETLDAVFEAELDSLTPNDPVGMGH